MYKPPLRVDRMVNPSSKMCNFLPSVGGPETHSGVLLGSKTGCLGGGVTEGVKRSLKDVFIYLS